MKKIKYYLDTTIFNFMFAEDDPEKKKITENLFQKLPSQAEGIFISDVVLKEIEGAKEPKRSQLENLINKIQPTALDLNLESETLAEKYIDEGIIPEKYRNDAFHIAIAVSEIKNKN